MKRLPFSLIFKLALGIQVAVTAGCGSSFSSGGLSPSPSPSAPTVTEPVRPGGSGASPIVEPTPEPAAKSRNLKVLSYNVKGIPCLENNAFTQPIKWILGKCPLVNDGLTQDNSVRMQTIATRLGKMTDAQKPDLVLFQEAFRTRAQVFDDSHVKKLSQIAGYPYHVWGPDAKVSNTPGGYIDMIRKARDTRGLLSSGLLILSRHPIEEVRRIEFSDCAEDDCAASKGVLLVRVRVPGVPGAVDIFNTHLQASEPHDAIRRRQNRVFHSFVRQQSRAPWLIAGGDFNFLNSDRRPSFKDFLDLTGMQHSGTVCANHLNIAPHCRLLGTTTPAHARGGVLDHQFFATDRPSFKITPVQVQIQHWTYRGDRPLSDHRPHMVTYRLSWE